MNTTGLISNWSMAGAREELQRRYAPATDILAAVAEGDDEPQDDATSAPQSHVMVKRAGEDDWQPLVAGA